MRFQIIFVSIALLGTASAQRLLPYGEDVGDTSFTDEDWARGYRLVDLSQPVSIFGRAMFNQIYVNSVGAVSFGSPLTTHILDDIINDVIVFAPLLIPIGDNFTNRSIYYRMSRQEGEIEAVGRMFGDDIADDSFQPSLVFIATYDYTVDINSKQQRNNFQVVIASDADSTYVKYGYRYVQYVKSGDYHARVGQFALAEGAMSCMNEVEGSGTGDVSSLWTHSNTGSRGNFYWRIDLPLQCKVFKSDCGKIVEPSPDFNVCAAGYFFETVSPTMWQFYRLYFCSPGKKRAMGTVSVKQECRYDSDYYTYEWRVLGMSDQCSKDIEDFWENYFSSSKADLVTPSMQGSD